MMRCAAYCWRSMNTLPLVLGLSYFSTPSDSTRLLKRPQKLPLRSSIGRSRINARINKHYLIFTCISWLERRWVEGKCGKATLSILGMNRLTELNSGVSGRERKREEGRSLEAQPSSKASPWQVSNQVFLQGDPWALKFWEHHLS